MLKLLFKGQNSSQIVLSKQEMFSQVGNQNKISSSKNSHANIVHTPQGKFRGPELQLKSVSLASCCASPCKQNVLRDAITPQ